jgi:hypothetical protein
MMASRATRRPHRRLGALLVATAIALGVPIAPAGAADPVIDVSGDATVGSQLTAVATYDPGTAAAVIDWLRCGATTPDTCDAIPGTSTPAASGEPSAYTVAPEDAGSRLRARITFTDPSGASATSAPTAVVETPAPPPTPTPTPTPSPTPTPTPTPTPDPTRTVDTTAAGQPVFSVQPTAAGVLKPRATTPPVLRPFPVVRIKGFLTAGGAQVVLLTVRAPAGARIAVACRGSGCPERRWSRMATLVHARPFERHELRAGARMVVSVMRRGYVGKQTVIVVRRGRTPLRHDACLFPGSRSARPCRS